MFCIILYSKLGRVVCVYKKDAFLSYVKLSYGENLYTATLKYILNGSIVQLCYTIEIINR